MEKGSSSSSSSVCGGDGGGTAADSLNGLKFGKKIYFEGSLGSGLSGGGAPPPAAAGPGSPAKKGRSSAVQVAQPPRCQVEGCNLDLSDAKAYYSRHKVCGMHSKSPKVTVAGIEQRFCQQCSRFHQLPEFDQGKRSCRRRLAGHNERRRKPPPGSLMSPRYGNLCPNVYDNRSKTGGFMMDFSEYPPITGLGNQVSNAGKYNLPMQSSSQSQPLTSNLLQGTIATTASRSSYSGPQVCSEECYGALSLLSNQPWGSRSRPPSNLEGNNFLGTNGVPPSVNPGPPIGQFASPPWGFKANQDNNTLHEMSQDLGLGQTSHPGSQCTGDLGLGQPSEGQLRHFDQSGSYDSSLQHMHWSL